jgi:hypothetical protein
VNACSSLVRSLLSLFGIKRREFLPPSVIKILNNAKVRRMGQIKEQTVYDCDLVSFTEKLSLSP